MKEGRFLSCFLAFSLVVTPSSYVLPYPSFMPGHKLYKVEEIFDRVYGLWCFGSFAQFKYNLKMADKELVEAKTLFEYGQLYLGTKALEKYRFYVSQTLPALIRARNEGKDISQKRELLTEALKKHEQVLKKLLAQVPESFFWQEEKKEGQRLELRREINSVQSEVERISQRLQGI